MVLLTALQVTANVYASFKYMSGTGNTDWTYWQKSILFGVQASTPEMYQVIISWIAGALLPIVALGMTALVAQNMTFMKEENEEHPQKPEDDHEKKVQEFLDYNFKGPENTETKVEPEPPTKAEIDEIIENEVEKRMTEIPLQTLIEKYKSQNNPEGNVIDAIIDDGGISNELDVAEKFEKEGTPEPELKKAAEKATEEMAKHVEETRVDVMDDLDRDVIALTPEFPGKYEQKFPGLTQTMKEIYEEIGAEETAGNIKKLLEGDIRPEPNENIKTSTIYHVTEIPTPPKKRGRPPKQQTDTVVESKKEQEPLPKEEVKVPQKPKRSVNPLKRKAKKIKPLKNLKEINKPSKGDEVIALLEKMEKDKQKESITPLIENEPETQESLLVPPELKDNYSSYILNGVEVIDAKAIPVKKNQ
jgi:hypothetical protein